MTIIFPEKTEFDIKQEKIQFMLREAGIIRKNEYHQRKAVLIYQDAANLSLELFEELDKEELDKSDSKIKGSIAAQVVRCLILGEMFDRAIEKFHEYLFHRSFDLLVKKELTNHLTALWRAMHNKRKG